MRLLIILFILLSSVSCQSIYFSAMEKVGIHKRDIFVDRVVDAKESQEEAKLQFRSALEKFQEVLVVDGGELQTKYEELNKEYKAIKSKAADVNERIGLIDSVAQALFDEWEDELEAYENERFKNLSAEKLKKMRKKYTLLRSSMQKAADSMAPVLSSFSDQVLFLKHNLNSRAIAGIKSEVKKIETDVAGLIKEMESSIKKSEVFINDLKE